MRGKEPHTHKEKKMIVEMPTIRELRVICNQLGIPHYSRMNRIEMIREIKRRRR